MFERRWCGGSAGHWADASTFRKLPGKENKFRQSVCENCYQKRMQRMRELRAEGFTG